MFSFLKDKLVLAATQDGSRIEKGEDVSIILFKSTFQIRLQIRDASGIYS